LTVGIPDATLRDARFGRPQDATPDVCGEGVDMAKALVGYRVASDPRLMLETVELRRRVRDLEFLVERLQRDNDQLREDLRQPDVVAAGMPTIAG
jgi:hypothetical protein